MFRDYKIWSNLNKCWLEPEFTQISADGSFVYNCGDTFNEEEVTICQFTGQVDNHGKKIYEHDFVLVKESSDRGDGFKDDRLCLCEYDDELIAFVAKEIDSVDSFKEYLGECFDLKLVASKFNYPNND